MTDRVSVSGLQVAKPLFDLVERDVLPGLGLESEQFWAGLSRIVTTLGPKRTALLAKRDTLQQRQRRQRDR